MTADDQPRPRSTYDSGDPVALYDATAETKTRLCGALLARLPQGEGLRRAIDVKRHFQQLDAFDVDALMRARDLYRAQLDALPDARADPDLERIYRDEVSPWLFVDAEPAVTPKALLIGGQPGAGKSRAINVLRPNGAVDIIGDELRAFHPDYDRLMATDHLAMPDATAAAWNQSRPAPGSARGTTPTTR